MVSSSAEPVSIALDDPTRADVRALIESHLREMHAWSSPESCHALDLDGLVEPGLRCWTARALAHPDGRLLGMAALKSLPDGTVELKSMRTTAAARGQGVGRLLLEHLVEAATAQHAGAILLETGTQEEFLPARRLYLSRGFVEIPPFGDYVVDPECVYLRLDLPASSRVA